MNDLSQALTANPPQSVLLIGPSGVGKTAAVLELARRWHAGNRTPIFQTSGARIVAGQTGFGMWQERCQELIKDAKKRKAVVHVGQLVELLEVGKSEHNASGIAAFLRPAIARGELLCIAECAPEQIPLVEKQDPQLLDAFRLTRPGTSGSRALAHSRINKLSGGEYQRVSLARAIAHRPTLVFVDEPPAALNRQLADMAYAWLDPRIRYV